MLGEQRCPPSSSSVQRGNSSTPSTSYHQPCSLPRSNESLVNDLSGLFNWNPKNAVGRKRKIPSRQKSGLKKKIARWSHTFVCLANSNQETLPDGDERARLQIAGLGEKKISLCSYSDAQDIYHDLLYHFPKLSDGGGFDLLRVPEGGGKQLDIITAPESGYTVSFLKAVVHHAKIYIRPVQKDLSLDPAKDEVRVSFRLYLVYPGTLILCVHTCPNVGNVRCSKRGLP